MKSILLTVAIAMASLLTTINAQADEIIESYTAVLSEQDHYNSEGDAINTVAGVIRQDRANFHKFGIRQDGDTPDNFFRDKSNRAQLEDFINQGSISSGAANAILNTCPLVLVNIMQGRQGPYVEITVIPRKKESGRSSVTLE